MDEPLDTNEARRLIRAILKTGTLTFSGHAYEEMAKDNMTEVDVRNTLNGGACQPAEFENGSWRYRFETQKFAAVIAFRSEDHAVVITAWRFKR